jgi:ribosome-binding factor A
MKQYDRATRLGEQILRDVSELMDVELKDQFPGLVTFTHVKLTRDLRYATVYFSFLGKPEDRPRIEEYLDRERRRIRAMVGRGLRMRHIPEFSFKFDPSIEEGMRIEQLLNEIKSDDTEND